MLRHNCAGLPNVKLVHAVLWPVFPAIGTFKIMEAGK
jgi:hypothetical protein